MPTNRMRPIHPGEILREEFLIPLEMTPHALAVALHVPASRINDIALGRRAVSADTAARLSRFFGTSAEFWMNLQSAYDLRSVDTESIERTVRPLKRRAA